MVICGKVPPYGSSNRASQPAVQTGFAGLAWECGPVTYKRSVKARRSAGAYCEILILALGELEAFARARAAVFLPFVPPRIAGEEA